MLKIGQRFKVEAKNINSEGQVEYFIKRDKVLVKNLILNEVAEVEVVKVIKDAYIGKVVKLIKASENRIKPLCPIYERCGSCHLLHQTYASQLVEKQEMVKNLAKNENLNIKVAPTCGMDNPYAYRNKIIMGYTRDKQRKLVQGFYEEYSHNIIPFKRCLLHEEKVDKLLGNIHQILERFKVEPYNADRRTGLLRHVLIRRGFATDETMVVFVVSKKDMVVNRIAKELLKTNPEITTVLMNVNSRKTSIVLGEEEKVLYGPGFIVDKLCGLKFKLSAKSFYQINHDQTEKLYEKAISLLKLSGKEVLMDAYSGIGTIGMTAYNKVNKVISVELNKDAVKDAKINAKMNNITNIQFFNDDATKFMVNYANQRGRVDALIIDPPRSGTTLDFIKAAAKLAPKQICYVSCDPKTLVRDLALFKKHGYLADTIYPYDMFPQTKHVENVVLLNRKG